MSEPWEERPDQWSARYHVPRSQVWEGSRGGQAGNVHLHLPIEPRDPWMPRAFTATTGRATTIERYPGAALCKRSAWYDRPGEPDEARCPKCVDLAERYGIEWPPEPHPCGHREIERGCGGCDPGAIESVIEDGGAVRPFDPARDLAPRLAATVSCDTCGGSGWRVPTGESRAVPCTHGRG